MRRYRNGIALIAAAVTAIAWGDAVDGLRLGIGYGAASQLRVVLENDGKVERNIPLGSSSGKGAVYDFEFTLVSPAGKEFLLFNLNGPAGVAASPEPIVAHLAPKASYEVPLLLNKIVFLDNGKNLPLPEMLKLHYSVRVSLDTTPNARAERTRSEWTGKLIRGSCVRVRRHVKFAGPVGIDKLDFDVVADTFDMAVAPVFKRPRRGRVRIDFIRRPINDEDPAAICLPSWNALIGKTSVGVSDAPVVFFFVRATAPLPELLN